MSTNDAAGRLFGKYRLLAELGRGGMARVFLAVVQGPGGFNKLLVVKQMNAQLADDPDFFQMFLDEARLAARLNHPNVVQTNEVGHHDGLYFIAMEYLEGQPLNRIVSRLTREEKLTRAMHLRVVSDCLPGLHYAHELKDYDGTPLQVVHRDVSPHNVFVTYNGQVKVVDFGIAKALSSSTETKTGVLKGKVAYMAPEQARADKVDRRADLYAIGVMLWEAATGKRLFKGMPDVAILQKLLMTKDVPRPSDVKPDVPPELERIVLKAMAFERQDRYATALEVQADVEAYMKASGEAATSVRDVGAVVEQVFADDRARIAAVVEQQLKSDPADPLLLIDSPPTVDYGPGSSLSSLSARGVDTTPTTRGTGKANVSIPTPAEMPATREGTGSIAANVNDPRRSSARRSLPLALLAVACIGGGVGAFALIGGRAHTDAAVATGSATVPAAAAHVLTLDTIPPGAVVTENGKELGKTPLKLPIDDGGALRAFHVELEGYAPQILQQGPAKGDVTLSAALAPVAKAPAQGDSAHAGPSSGEPSTASAEPRSKASPPPRTAPRAAPPPPPRAAPTSQPLDIKLTR